MDLAHLLLNVLLEISLTTTDTLLTVSSMPLESKEFFSVDLIYLLFLFLILTIFLWIKFIKKQTKLLIH